MNLVRTKMVDVLRTATGSLHPLWNRSPVRPDIMRLALAAVRQKRNKRDSRSHFGILRS